MTNKNDKGVSFNGALCLGLRSLCDFLLLLSPSSLSRQSRRDFSSDRRDFPLLLS